MLNEKTQILTSYLAELKEAHFLMDKTVELDDDNPFFNMFEARLASANKRLAEYEDSYPFITEVLKSLDD